MKNMRHAELDFVPIKIKLLALDIDGVLTDGRLIIDTPGNEYKTINYRDLDGITWLRNKGLNLALLTGEDNALVDAIAKRFNIANIVKGAKDKEKALKQLSEDSQVSLQNICYVGDADRDAPALKLCGLGMVPQDATERAKGSASVVLRARGGDGLVTEVIEYLIQNDCL